MLDAFDSVLDGLSELIYVSDPATHELLYLNRAGREVYGEHVTDNAPACYRVLQGLEAPCPFCTNHLLNDDTFYEWEFTNPTVNRHYLLRDILVTWEGRPARLEIAFDVTDRQRENEEFRFLADAGITTVDCIRLLDAEGSLSEALDKALGRLGSFLEADRSYIFQIEHGKMSNTFEWCREGVTPEKDILQDLPVTLIDSWIERFKAGSVVVIEDINDLLIEGRQDEYEILGMQDITSLVAVPLEIDGEFIGYMGVDNPRKNNILEIIEKPLIAFANFVSARIGKENSQRRMEELIWSDALTGTYSRAAFHRDYDQGEFSKVGFALVDADRLSEINREQGRAAGDEVLRRIGVCMREVFGDHVYRIGDDEFCAAIEAVDYAHFGKHAAQLEQLLHARGLAASLGTAWHESANGTTSLLNIVGDRMRNAKRGRHRATDLGIDLASDAAVSSLLRPGGAQQAADEGRLTIFLMPQAKRVSGEIASAEALIRYNDVNRGMQALPASFIPALEDMDEISAVDYFALAKACETLVRWKKEGTRVIPLAVNFSRRTISESNFVDRVVEVVSSYGLDASLIEIEITESAREDNISLLRQVTSDLRDHGFRIAIDDFGVENANFSLFIEVQFDVLKIDKSLVWGLGTVDRTMQVICGLVALADELGIETVAEGIETLEQRNALREAGCTRAQGYHVGKPIPIDQFEEAFLK